MKHICIVLMALLSLTSFALAQQVENRKSIFKVPKDILAGERLDSIPQSDPTRTIYQKKVYDGEELAIYMVAIGTGITNVFDDFPLEEFIYWMNGKAVVEPKNEEAFEIYTGDYFIQAKGFEGKWNFVDNEGLHLELAVVAKNRPDTTLKSPISKALVIDRDVISGVSKISEDGSFVNQGVELTVKVLNQRNRVFQALSQERMVHILSGTLKVNDQSSGTEEVFYPGDFFVIPEGFSGTWSSNSLQALRVIEVYKTRL